MHSIKDNKQNIGVIIKDRDFKIGNEVREALRSGRKIFLVKSANQKPQPKPANP